MTPEIEKISSILSASFIIYLISCFYLGKMGIIQGSTVSDRFNIGYIEQVKTPSEPIYEKYIPKKVQPKPTPTTRPSQPISTIKQQPTVKIKPEPKQPINTVLFDECVVALIALGFKKSQAKVEVKQYLKNHSMVEEFLRDYFVKRTT